jgi:hypothetical protein
MTERKARAGEGLPSAQTPAAEAKAAMAGFLKEFSTLSGRREIHLETSGRATDHVERKDDVLWPAGPFGQAEVEAPHQKAFNAYLRNGDDDGLRGLTLEGKAMSTQRGRRWWRAGRPADCRPHPVDAAVRPRPCGRWRMWCRSTRSRSTC